MVLKQKQWSPVYGSSLAIHLSTLTRHNHKWHDCDTIMMWQVKAVKSAVLHSEKERMSQNYKVIGNVDNYVEEESESCPLLDTDEGKHKFNLSHAYHTLYVVCQNISVKVCLQFQWVECSAAVSMAWQWMAMSLNFITFSPTNTFHLIKIDAAVNHDTQKFSFNPPQKISRSKVNNLL